MNGFSIDDFGAMSGTTDVPVYVPPQTTVGPSGMASVNNATTATQNLSSAPNWLTNFGLGEQRGRNFGFGLNIRDTDTNFDRTIDKEIDTDRDIDKEYEENLLTQEQCDRINACIVSLETRICGEQFARYDEMVKCADKIFDEACALESKLLENIQCQIEEAKCQFYREARKRWSMVARAVGSSRNTFVIQQQNTAMVDLTRQLASLSAKLQNDAILSSHENLRQAYSVKIESRTNLFNAMHSQYMSLWGLIRGAKRTINEHTDDVVNTVEGIVEDSFQDVTTFDWTGKYAEAVTQSSESNTAYNGDYGSIGAIQGILGLITP